MNKLKTLLCTLAVLVVSLPAARAGMLPDADTREVRAYVLTEAGFAKYMAATHKLRGTKFENCSDDDDDEVESIASLAARIDAVPAAKSALQAAGMTTHEYLVFGFALLENGMADYMMQTPGGKLPPGINPANVDFVKRHSTELHQLANESDVDPCEHDDGD